MQDGDNMITLSLSSEIAGRLSKILPLTTVDDGNRTIFFNCRLLNKPTSIKNIFQGIISSFK